MADMGSFHKQFYEIKDKVYQDNFVLKYTSAQAPQRRRVRVGTGRQKQMSIRYSVRKVSGESVRVCKDAFMKILHINKTRLNGVVRRNKQSGLMAHETRGGDRKSEKFGDLKVAICNFVKNFKGVESHYCRSKSKRIYLPSELNITKMFKMFKTENPNLNCKQSYFRKVFTTKFNIGFCHPRSDICSKCLQYGELIKLEQDEEKRGQLKNELTLHKKRGNAFFEFLKDESPDLMILSFDCQKNQNLPKVPDQAAYYSRQLYVFNFTIVKGTSKDDLTAKNVFSYVWTEDEHAKGSNEIASALYDYLTSQTTSFEGIKTLRLMCDGCPGQNKNSTLVATVCKWLSSNAPDTLKKVEMIFPIPGHSYIPPDRVFGVTEKEIKTRNTIIDPEEYINIFREHATVKMLGKEVVVYDWKKSLKGIIKDPKDFHFKISECKRLIFSRLKKDNRNIVVRGEMYYNNDIGARKCLTKAGRLPCHLNPQPIAPGEVAVKPAKIADVKKLLRTHFGDDWAERPQLRYYTSLLSTPETIPENAEEQEHNLLCEEHMDFDPPSQLI